jgi:predicted esterase
MHPHPLRTALAIGLLGASLGGCASDGGGGTPVDDGSLDAGSGGAGNAGGSTSAGGNAGSPGAGGAAVMHTGGTAGAGMGGAGGGSPEGGTSGGSTGGGNAAGGAGSGGAGGSGGFGSPCTLTQATVKCVSEPVVTITSGADARRVWWAVPEGDAPAAGFPAVLLFQGSLFGPATTWDVELPKDTTPFGGDVQVELVDTLVRHGFVVVQPEAPGGVAWNTNTAASYDQSQDGVFMPKLFAELEKGTFGDVDVARLFATGISSGGYMTSRMAVSYPRRFRALAIESASYATCVGPLCSVPATLPAEHPPTLFLHGAADAIVPIATARDYFTKLSAAGIETKFVEDAPADHRWIDAAPAEILDWFEGR